MSTYPLDSTALASLLSRLDRLNAPASLVADVWALRGMSAPRQVLEVARIRDELAALAAECDEAEAPPLVATVTTYSGGRVLRSHRLDLAP